MRSNGNSLLWKIEGNRLTATSYILGTMHLMCAEDAILSDETVRIINAVDQIYLEADLRDLQGAADLGFTIKMKGDITLRELLDKEEYLKVKTSFELHQKVGFELLEQQQPLMVSSSLYDFFLPCESKKGIDTSIVELATTLNKEIKGLETLAFQISLLNNIPYQEQAKELVKTIDRIKKFQTVFEDMVILYKAQDIEGLHELATREEAGMGRYTNFLLYDRNYNWVEQINLIANEGSTLFAVGAGHLGGEKGLLNLLKQKGFNLTPIVNRYRPDPFA